MPIDLRPYQIEALAALAAAEARGQRRGLRGLRRLRRGLRGLRQRGHGRPSTCARCSTRSAPRRKGRQFDIHHQPC